MKLTTISKKSFYSDFKSLKGRKKNVANTIQITEKLHFYFISETHHTESLGCY